MIVEVVRRRIVVRDIGQIGRHVGQFGEQHVVVVIVCSGHLGTGLRFGFVQVLRAACREAYEIGSTQISNEKWVTGSCCGILMDDLHIEVQACSNSIKYAIVKQTYTQNHQQKQARKQTTSNTG